MSEWIPEDRPLFEIGPKSYLFGDDVLALARAADLAAADHEVTVVFTSPILEARKVVESVENLIVCIPHLDPIHPGRGITDILPEALADAGIRMVMLNHAERPITFSVLEQTMRRAREVGLATAVCASSLAEVRAVASLHPEVLVAEPTELIGTGKPSGFAYVDASNRAVGEIDPRIRVLQGAGISTPEDVFDVIAHGANATGSSSAIAQAPSPPDMAIDMIAAARRGWDAREKTLKNNQE